MQAEGGRGGGVGEPDLGAQAGTGGSDEKEIQIIVPIVTRGCATLPDFLPSDLETFASLLRDTEEGV